MMWLVSHKVTVSSLLVSTELRSANPKSEWSVKTVLRPMVLAWNSASWAMAEKELWAWTTVIHSRTNTHLSSGKLWKQVVAVD